MNLVYFSSFGATKKNIFLCVAAIWSVLNSRNSRKNYDILLYLDEVSKRYIGKNFPGLLDQILVWTADYWYTSCVDESSWARYDIFYWIDIHRYSNILYLDTDILVSQDLCFVFDLVRNNNYPVLVKSEKSNLSESYHGQRIFEYYEKGMDFDSINTFSTGVIGFKNSCLVEDIFSKAQIFSRVFIQDYRKTCGELDSFSRCDQPTLNYLLAKESVADVGALDHIVRNNPTSSAVVAHFPGVIGNRNKPVKMLNYMLMPCNYGLFVSELELLMSTELIDCCDLEYLTDESIKRRIRVLRFKRTIISLALKLRAIPLKMLHRLGLLNYFRAFGGWNLNSG